MINCGVRLVDASEEPLHHQLRRQLRARVLSGVLSADDALPSIRTLARELRVSVITVQRAYDDLEAEKLIQARRGKGFFVRKLSEKDKVRMAEARLAERLARSVGDARADGLGDERLRAVFERALGKGKR